MSTPVLSSTRLFMQIGNGKGTIFPGFFHQLLQRRIAGIFETSDFDMTHSLSCAYQDMLKHNFEYVFTLYKKGLILKKSEPACLDRRMIL